MAERLRWWVIPGAFVVLVRVVTLGGAGDDAGPTGFATEASAPAGEVAVAEANGRRIGPVAVDAAGAAVLRVPTRWRGTRGEMTVWRRDGGVRASAPWLVLRPRVRDDGTIPFAGLVAGSYDFEFRVGGTKFVATAASVPGEVVLSADR